MYSVVCYVVATVIVCMSIHSIVCVLYCYFIYVTGFAKKGLIHAIINI